MALLIIFVDMWLLYLEHLFSRLHDAFTTISRILHNDDGASLVLFWDLSSSQQCFSPALLPTCGSSTQKCLFCHCCFASSHCGTSTQHCNLFCRSRSLKHKFETMGWMQNYWWNCCWEWRGMRWQRWRVKDVVVAKGKGR